MIDLVFRNQIKQNEFTEDFFRSVIEITVKEVQLADKNIEISISIVSPPEIQELNKTHRGKDKPTDVLSFPLHEGALKKYDIMPLGDIFICFDVAKKGALEEGVSIEEEMARLTVHGFLHLLGHDHEKSEADHELMIDLQEKIVRNFLTHASANHIRH